jgi:serine protease Do
MLTAFWRTNVGEQSTPKQLSSLSQRAREIRRSRSLKVELMIRRTLGRTQAATFSVDLPEQSHKGMPTPAGTGFFVSGDGWFVTAAHVIMQDEKVRDDIDQAWLMKESRPGQIGAMCQFLELKHVDSKNDFALIKVDFSKNSNKEWLKARTEFPFLLTSVRDLEEGEPVYSFGYPLSMAGAQEVPGIIVGTTEYSPRTTSAIISSTFEKSKMVMSSSDTKLYVLDRALNYGNSGGPIVAQSTGNVHAFCTRFQPMAVRQKHLEKNGLEFWIHVPSLYGIVVSLNNPEIQKTFADLNIIVAQT